MTRYSRYIPPWDREQNRSSDYVSHGDKYGGSDEYFAHDESGKAIAMASVFSDPGGTRTHMTTFNPDTAEDTLIADGQRANQITAEAHSITPQLRCSAPNDCDTTQLCHREDEDHAPCHGQ